MYDLFFKKIYHIQILLIKKYTLLPILKKEPNLYL